MKKISREADTSTHPYTDITKSICNMNIYMKRPIDDYLKQISLKLGVAETHHPTQPNCSFKLVKMPAGIPAI